MNLNTLEFLLDMNDTFLYVKISTLSHNEYRNYKVSVSMWSFEMQNALGRRFVFLMVPIHYLYKNHPTIHSIWWETCHLLPYLNDCSVVNGFYTNIVLSLNTPSLEGEVMFSLWFLSGQLLQNSLWLIKMNKLSHFENWFCLNWCMDVVVKLVKDFQFHLHQNKAIWGSLRKTKSSCKR